MLVQKKKVKRGNMGNKEDWEKLEKWESDRKRKLKDSYGGVDILKLKEETKETTKKIAKFNKIGENIVKAMLICYALVIVLIIIGGMIIHINQIKETKEKLKSTLITQTDNI